MAATVILHNIRSAHNVGAVFRTADGAGVSKVYLTGYTPAPVDRFGRENKEILKTSLGATKTVPYEVYEDIFSLIEKLTHEKKSVVAVEQTKKSQDYRTVTTDGEPVFIFGNEITGIERDVLDVVETHIAINMQGKKESLNVSVCAGIILFHYI